MDSGLFQVMLPLFPSFILVLLAGPAMLTPSTIRELQVRDQRTPRAAEQDSIKVVISEGCSSQGDSSDMSQGGKEIDLAPGSPLVLTHKIKLVPSGSGSGSCGCDADFTALRERLESLEREMSDLRGKCGETGGSCCTSESKGAGCSIKPDNEECPNECSDQGRCVDGKCVCFPGYSGPDCSKSGCPGNCDDHGRCVDGECVCDPGFSGPDCSQKLCPDNCSDRGRCVNGQCVCDAGFTGPSCSEQSCPRNCNRRGQCVNGQCVCNAGFTGPDCSKKGCPDNCNNRGRCANGKCVCDTGFTGADCSKVTCPGNCNNRGSCVNGQCVCDDGFTGKDCQDKTCPNDCNRRGRCVDGRCVCNKPYTGTDCSEITCPGNCNNRGRCVNGQCVCDDGFTGKDCQDKTCPNDCNRRGRCVDGRCVCNEPYTGNDCSETTCPGNCNSRGSCVNGQCVCDDGFTGADCSEQSCPNDCSNRGRCVDGQCVCEGDFTGDDCSEYACPGNCNNRGRCVDGRCVCNEGFAGEDCSQQACPNNCNNHGRCVNGKCICDVGFSRPDCGARGCPNDCSGKGQCIKGKCVCRRGFTGPDCSQCKEGLTGPNCNIAMTGVSQLSVEDITESSVTLIWTQPVVQYDTYYITFTSQKETDQQLTLEVDGSLTTFTQMGLAAGQEYIVSIVGEINGRRGVESTAEFMTLISGPKNLQVVKTTTTSAVVQWEQAQGEIDRYRLTVTPNDGAGRTQEMTVEAGQSSAQIQQLEAGRLYDVLLVAEKGVIRSQPATVQVVPGNTFPKATIEDLTMRVTQAPGQDVGSISRDVSASVSARTGPSLNSPVARNNTRLKFRRPQPTKPWLFNATRVGPGGRPYVPRPLHKNPMVSKKSEQKEMNKTKPDVHIIKESVTDQSEEASSSERSGNQSPAVMPGSDFDPNGERTSEEPSYAGSQRQPDAGIAEAENDTHSVSSEPTGNIRSQEKKCLNKIKLTHVRLPLKNRGNGCREDGIGGKTLSPEERSSPEEMPPNEEKGLDHPPDPLHKLITDTFRDINITTISVQLAEPLNLSVDADMISKQILSGLKPFPSLLASSPLTAQSSYVSDTKSSSPAAEPQSLPRSSLTDLIQLPSSSKPSLPLSSPSSSSTSMDDLESQGSIELDSSSNAGHTENRDLPSSEESSKPPFQYTYPKRGSARRSYPKLELFQNKPHRHFRDPVNSAPNLRNTSVKETKNVSSSPSLYASRKSPSLEANLPVKDGNGEGDGITTNATAGMKESQKHIQTERLRIPLRRPPQKGTYPRRLPPNLQNRTRPISRDLTQHSKSSNSNTDSLKEQMLPIALTKTFSRDTVPSDTVPEGNEERTGARFPKTSVSNEFHQITRETALPSSRQPNLRHPHQRGESVQNKTFTNPRYRQQPHRGTIRRPFFKNKLDGSTSTIGNQTNELGKESAVNNPESQTGKQNVHRFTHSFQRNLSGEQVNGMLRQKAGMHEQKTPVSTENALMQPDTHTGSDIKERDDTDRDTGATNQRSPSVQTDFKHSRLVTLPRGRPASTTIIAPHQDGQSIDGVQKKELPKANPTATTAFDTETEESEGPASEVSSSGDKREPLDFVAVTNQTSDGFTVIWDSPEGKYKNFVVSRTEAETDEGPKQKEGKQDEVKDQHSSELSSEHGGGKDNNKVPEDFQVPNAQKGAADKPTDKDKPFRQVLRGSARSLQFEHLRPQTEYTITLLGKGPGVLSRLHKLVISTGPEPPSNIVFSKVTENSLTVSWTKPKSSVNSFKVTYTNVDDGEPVSVTVGSQDSNVGLSQLSPGSTYEVTIISTLGLDESDPIKDSVMTLPDPPTDLQAVNVTDSSALLLWRPALAAVDNYAIVYGSGTDSELRVSVSGNAAEQQLSGLEGSTTYTVTITSQLGSQESSPATTSFTTKSGSGWNQGEAQDLKANNVTPRSAVVSWTPSSNPVDKYILVYWISGQNPQEIIVNPNITQYKLTRLHPGSLYTVELRSIRGGQKTNINTEFTTGTLRFPFPTDCSQELLNGIFTSDVVEIFPQGKPGNSMNVYCDMETDGGGWTVFQRRKDGSVDFYNRWKEYVSGFGDLTGEFWLGLDRIHNLTKMTKMNLRVDLRDGDERVFAKYSTFEVAKRNYKLSVGGYSGTAGDSLTYHNNCVFSTKDRDPARWVTRCAISYQGGWWYKNCHEANLNGLYGIDYKHQGVIWKSWKGEDHSIQFTEMKMRPASFTSPVRRAK